MMLILGFYKEYKGQDYNKIIEEVDLGFTLNHKSFSHNWPRLREKLVEWGRSRTHLGSAKKWNKAAPGTSTVVRVIIKLCYP